MKFLIANDDGIDSLGLACLVKALQKLPDAEIYVCAPGEQQSGKSHSINIHVRMPAEIVEYPGAKMAIKLYSTPADCVLVGRDIFALYDIYPDFVFSGINHGYNTAEDTIYSGTVGAAMEGSICGYPSIAVSTERIDKTKPYTEEMFDAAAEAAIKLIPVAMKQHPGVSLNLNVPPIPMKDIKGWKVTKVGTIDYHKTLVWDEMEDGKRGYYYDVTGKTIGEGDDLDRAVLEKGYISVTPLYWNMGVKSAMPALEEELRQFNK